MSSHLKWVVALNIFEGLACLSGFIFWRKYRHHYWKWFAIYLGVIFATEITAEYLGHVLGLIKPMYRLYFFFAIPLQFLFFFWLFSKWYDDIKKRRWSYIGAGVYIIAWWVEFFYLQHAKLVFQSFSYTVGNIVLLLLILQFFIGFINSDRILNYRQEPMFWVCLGLMVFYLMTLPFFGLWNTLVAKYARFFSQYWIGQMVLNCMMYTFFALSFMLGKWKQPSSSY